MDSCIKDFRIPVERQEPWGTGHGILVAKDVINEAFAVINADDFYGPETFKLMSESLTKAENSGNQYYMAGFLLRNTLSEYGRVSRAIGKVNKKMFLEKMTEHTRIEKRGSQIVSFDAKGKEQKFSGDEIVSMNFWGFRPSIFGFLQTQFADFLRVHAGAPKSQFFIPAAVDCLIRSGKALVEVLPTTGNWFGVTYREDRVKAQETIARLVSEGVYPERLWQP